VESLRLNFLLTQRWVIENIWENPESEPMSRSNAESPPPRQEDQTPQQEKPEPHHELEAEQERAELDCLGFVRRPGVPRRDDADPTGWAPPLLKVFRRTSRFSLAFDAKIGNVSYPHAETPQEASSGDLFSDSKLCGKG